MAETTMPSPNQKPEPSWQPGPLTPQEIESLRKDKQESRQHSLEFFKKHGVKPLVKRPAK